MRSAASLDTPQSNNGGSMRTALLEAQGPRTIEKYTSTNTDDKLSEFESQREPGIANNASDEDSNADGHRTI